MIIIILFDIMITIYALVCEELVLYVGQTKRTLEERLYYHKIKHNNVGSKFIPDYIEYEILGLEEVEDDKGTDTEKYYYDTLKPFYNIRRPGQSQKEYEQTVKCKEYRKKYHASKKITQ